MSSLYYCGSATSLVNENNGLMKIILMSVIGFSPKYGTGKQINKTKTKKTSE